MDSIVESKPPRAEAARERLRPSLCDPPGPGEGVGVCSCSGVAPTVLAPRESLDFERWRGGEEGEAAAAAEEFEVAGCMGADLALGVAAAGASLDGGVG
mmetsp:Transcript_44840/g.96690  ORF Transcript_44840/g.96690 Transcript_44840/m.96690 type:complete len:99 (+) Transcript_44840:1854-2150(+)